MMSRILAGSLTTDSWSAIRLYPANGRQGIRVGDRPALEQEVACLFIDEHGRAVVAVGVRVDSDEA